MSAVFDRLQAIVAEQLGVEPGLKFEVHQIHAAMRFDRNGRAVPQLIGRLTQQVPLAGTIGGVFHGGCTLVIDLAASEVKYCIRKRVTSATRRQRTLDFHAKVSDDPLRRLMLAAEGGEPFGLLHALGEHS